MKARPTQSRKGVKGGLRPFSSAPCRVKGQRPLWGLGQRPNSSASDQSQGSRHQRCRQRSVPAPNFARPQTRPPSCSIHHLCCVAPDGRDRTAGLSDIAALSRKQGISPLRRRPKGMKTDECLRSPFGNLRVAPMFIGFYRDRTKQINTLAY